MKIIVRIMMILFLLKVSLTGKSQIFLDENRYIKPIGFSIHGYSTYYLKGGGSPYLEYKEPVIPLTLPTEFPFKNIIPYQDLLFSGLQSLLFEYKNYQGQNDLSAYTVFALGNFRMLEDKVLIFLNKYIMNNQKLLQDIYKWAKPYYEKVFKELTIEEQKVIMQHVDVAEKYVLFVLKEKNKIKYQKWLADSKILPDKKITGFIQRRISKKQWTIEDCMFWINLLKKDISPLIKNDQNPASHFQIVKIINKQ